MKDDIAFISLVAKGCDKRNPKYDWGLYVTAPLLMAVFKLTCALALASTSGNYSKFQDSDALVH